jgi:hypothetical protein
MYLICLLSIFKVSKAKRGVRFILVTLHCGKTGYKWHNFYFTQQHRTNNNDLIFKCCILYKIIVSYIKNSASCKIVGVFAVQNES